MKCKHVDDVAACIATIDAHYGTHDPIKRPWLHSDCDNCRIRPTRIALRPPQPKKVLPPDDPRDDKVITCRECGKPLCAAVQSYQRSTTGLCRTCYQLARKNPATCKRDGCTNKARRRGLCHKHYVDWSEKCCARNAEKT